MAKPLRDQTRREDSAASSDLRLDLIELLPRLRNFVRSMTGAADQAEDLLREAFAQEPVPQRLVDTVLTVPDKATRLADVAPMRRRLISSPGWGMTLADSIVLGLGGFWAGRVSLPDTTGGSSLALATAELPTGDEIQLPDGHTARALASHLTNLEVCRMIAQDNARHVTCRDAQSGDRDIALSVHSGEAGSFLPSSTLSVELIDRLLEEIEADPALDEDEGRRALAP